MKLKVCFCNKTVLRTDITRFAPVWATYTLGLAMLVLLQFNSGSDDAAKAGIVSDLSQLCRLGVGINGFYAMFVVQALFGDMLTPRLCNGLHAMPITRDGYFGAHVVAGLLFALVPNTLILLLTAAMLPKAVASAAMVALLALCLQYVFYLGVALVSVQLAGNRIGMVLIYGILKHFEQRVKISVYIEKQYRLAVATELPERQNFKKLIECPNSAGSYEKSVRFFL